MASAPRNPTGPDRARLTELEALLDSDPAQVVAGTQAILKAAPRNTAAYRLLARAFERLGNTAGAQRARAEAVTNSRYVPAIAEAHRANLDGRAERVESLLRDHLAAYPDDPVALMVSGEAYTRLGRVNDAVRQLRAALSFMPEYGEAGRALVRAHHRAFDIPAALSALEPLLASRPGDPTLLRWKASLLSNLGQNEAAAGILSGLVRTHSRAAPIWISLGDELRTLGHSEQAYRAYRRAVSIDPKLGAAWWSLAALGHVPFDEEDRQRMEAALAGTSDPDNHYYLHFALATAHEKAGRHREAFENFAAGNAIRFRKDPFDPADLADEVERSRRILTPAFFAEREGAGSPAPDPIFVVSLPRSGSTLVEQVLASHPQVEGTAELPFVPILIRTLAAEHGLDFDSSYRELLPQLDPETFTRIGEEYLRLARAHRKTDKPYFIDKLPHNWTDVGFIKLILPNARIIDVRRSPMDCCWSNFRMLFATGHPSSNSLEVMAEYYRHYVAMMDHFDRALPGHVHHVVYERLVDDFEAEVRRLLDYLGLPFDPACLAFHTNARAVATASAEQVRRPLNRKGIGAWRTYEPWLGSLKDAVGDLEQTYADGASASR